MIDEFEKGRTISEAALIDNIRNGAVKRFTIRENAAGRYEIRVVLTWRKENLILITARKKVREWVSMDRLLRHIKENYGDQVPTIGLTLFRGEDETRNASREGDDRRRSATAH
jgi:hypothetical protein